MRDLKTLCETVRKSGAMLTVKEFAETVDYFEFSGVATTPKEDLIGDIVEPMGAEFALPIKLLSKHDSTKPIGEVYFAKATRAGIPYKARIPLVKEAGIVRERVLEAIHEVKYGLVSNVSIGFKALRDGIELLADGIRFTKWRWLELSLAPIPANDEATITAFKSLDVEIRAALGAQNRDAERGARQPKPGDSGTQSRGSKMRTMKQMLDRRTEVAARVTELHQGCGGDFATLGETERNEFDGLETELTELDVDIRRQKTVDAAARGATAITSEVGHDQQRSSAARYGNTKQEAPKTEKGIAYAQYLRLMYQAKNIPHVALQMATHQRNLDKRVVLTLKGDIEAGSVSGSSTAGNWGMELVGTENGVIQDFLEFLRPQTIVGKFGQGGIPALSRIGFRVPFGTMTTGGTAYWTGEGKAKPLTKFGFERNHLDPLKITAMCAVTKELLRDSSPSADARLRAALSAAIIEREDIDFIDPNKTASTGVSPASITNGVTPTPAAGTGDAGDVRTDVKAAMGAFLGANNPPTQGVWVMSATTALSLSLMTNALGQPEDFSRNLTMNGGSFAGLPVITSEYVPGDSSGRFVFLVNARDIFFNDDGGIQIDTSEHASLEMEDSPAHDSVTPTGSSQLVSMYQTNSVAFRAELTLDWMRARESAVAALSGVNWGAA